ncbi:MAG: phospho-N-acetylmuramoyl-pentapeptide-transferase [Flavobacteriales bacterium TMED288]|nr:phospho-N-acetylmuramoyl-pentapeptide-transferase [Flavobacteriales bacterium]RPG53818.1 MAG: phospho-N-acetylmuramoyl-pentapeptide-transferase [Flavobacteriales bacterium TMED288]|tara:strand:- start:147 stop:1352 length:1206 start_codon:yes stop_codon:yes gene_type:complete
MLYYLINYINKIYDIPGIGVFEYISFRASLALMISLLISLFLGGYIIKILKKYQVDDQIRELGLKGENKKKGTPTMGGFIIIISILIPTILICKINNIYILLMVITTIWLGLIGFIDDYIKVFKKNKKGLAAKFKIIGQVILGCVVGSILHFHSDVLVKTSKSIDNLGNGLNTYVKSSITTIPFFKNNELNYSDLISFLINEPEKWSWIIFIPIVIFIISAVSNASNLTDGMDGLAPGISAIIGLVLALYAYVSSNLVFSDYLNIMFIPYSEELVIFMSSFVGSCIGFLWYNSYPAQIFMGDTGSLSIGGIIAVFSIAIRKELLIPIFCGVFFIESISVIIQVLYFKYSRKKFGKGKRIFLMSPLHHHFQLKGIHESKIVTRFWILAVILAILSFLILKLR